MEQEKIGSFIKECRTKINLTQKELADKLQISHKTISKWECGKGLPDVSLLLTLCNELNISVNELLNGCYIEKEKYKEKAEETLLSVYQERQSNKKKLILATIIGLNTLLSAFTVFLSAGLFDIREYQRYILIGIGFIILLTGVITCCFVDNSAGYFECRYCKKKFIPSMKSFILGPHTLTTRQLKCPYCGKISYCKKRLSK